jgi:hypothetical protein
VGQLNTSNASLRSDESHNARQRFDMLIGPDTKIIRANTSDRCHSRGLGQDKSSAANGAAAEMHEVPFVRQAVNRGIFAHGRNGDAVGQSNATQGERFEQDSQMKVPFAMRKPSDALNELQGAKRIARHASATAPTSCAIC